MPKQLPGMTKTLLFSTMSITRSQDGIGRSYFTKAKQPAAGGVKESTPWWLSTHSVKVARFYRTIPLFREKIFSRMVGSRAFVAR